MDQSRYKMVAQQRSCLRFAYTQHIKHQNVLLQPTPRSTTAQTPRATTDFEGLPEGFLAIEGGQLSASFSIAPPRTGDERVPVITAIDVAQAALVDGNSTSVCIGDALGRIDHLETRGPCVSYSNQKLFRRHTHQAFVGEFDCLTSSPVDERVTALRYVHVNRAPGIVSYLAANERTIKLFRVRHEVSSSPSTGTSTSASPRAPSSLTTPRGPIAQKRIVMPTRVFTGPHKSPIQQLDICADGETFLSVDDLQVQWWHLESSDVGRATCITDLNPTSGKMDDVNQLITTALFHPSHGSLFLVGRSNGMLSVGDLRDPPSRASRSFHVNMQLLPVHNVVQHEEHDDILTSISGAAFLSDTFIVSRDYLGLKVWDTRSPSCPVARVSVMECLKPHLDKLYDADAIFDRFSVRSDPLTSTVVTGCYGGVVAVWNPRHESSVEFYGTDPYVPPGDAVADGLLSPKEVSEMFANGVSDEQREQRTLHVGISPNADRLCSCTTDHLFVFNRSLVD